MRSGRTLVLEQPGLEYTHKDGGRERKSVRKREEERMSLRSNAMPLRAVGLSLAARRHMYT